MEFRQPVEERYDADAGELPISRPTARRSRRMGGRPLLLLGAATALVVGTHLVLTATPSAPANPSEAPVSVAGGEGPESSTGLPAPEPDRPVARSTEPRATDSPRVTIAPARVPMTPGPAFAGSVPARPGADPAGAPRSTTPVPASAPAPPSVAPAPAGVELGLPDLPPDSVVSSPRTSDTMGMKRILRALNGAKPAEGSAAP